MELQKSIADIIIIALCSTKQAQISPWLIPFVSKPRRNRHGLQFIYFGDIFFFFLLGDAPWDCCLGWIEVKKHCSKQYEYDKYVIAHPTINTRRHQWNEYGNETNITQTTSAFFTLRARDCTYVRGVSWRVTFKSRKPPLASMWMHRDTRYRHRATHPRRHMLWTIERACAHTLCAHVRRSRRVYTAESRSHRGQWQSAPSAFKGQLTSHTHTHARSRIALKLEKQQLWQTALWVINFNVRLRHFGSAAMVAVHLS